MFTLLPLGHGPPTAAPKGGTWVWCIALASGASTSQAWKPWQSGQEGPRGVGVGEHLPFFSVTASREREGVGDRGAVPGWRRERSPGRRGSQAAFRPPRDSVTRGIPALPRAVPRCPCLPDPPSRPAALRARGAKVSVGESALVGAPRPVSQPRPLHTWLWRSGGTPGARAPGAGGLEAGRRGALTCGGLGSATSPECDFLGAAGRSGPSRVRGGPAPARAAQSSDP